MAARTGETGFYRILVAIETDATRYYGPEASRPALLGPRDAEQMLAHVAADLRALLPGIAECSLIAAGALFDQTQIMRPGYPVFAALEATAAAPANAPRPFKPGLVSIGAADGVMPAEALQPGADIPLGLLQLLPVVVHGPAPLVEELGQAMEYRFLEQGQLAPHSAAWLQTAFRICVNHARLMTLTDLNAMLRLQLDHFGFLPLWELLDAALSGRASALRVRTPSGKSLEWRDGEVHAVFETFDFWAREGGGAGLPAARLALAGGYGDWTREMRQYTTTLRAHGVAIRFHLPNTGPALAGTYFGETSEAAPQVGDPAVTEHSFGDLGTIAVTAVADGRIVNYYPLRPRGLNDIQAQLREVVRGGHTVAFPATILYDEQTRRLRPDRTA
jgi:hypothetical protein